MYSTTCKQLKNTCSNMVYTTVFIVGLIYLTWVCAYSRFLGESCIDLPKFTGGWYNILGSSNTVVANCSCPQFYYKLNKTDPSVVDVSSGCRLNNGTRMITNSTLIRPSPSQLPSHFMNTTDNSTSIILKMYRNTNGDYSDALIVGNNPNTFWLLSRSPLVRSDIVQDALWTLFIHNYNTISPVLNNQSQCPWLLEF